MKLTAQNFIQKKNKSQGTKSDWVKLTSQFSHCIYLFSSLYFTMLKFIKKERQPAHQLQTAVLVIVQCVLRFNTSIYQSANQSMKIRWYRAIRGDRISNQTRIHFPNNAKWDGRRKPRWWRLLLLFLTQDKVPGISKIKKTIWNGHQYGWSWTQKLSCSKTLLNRCTTTDTRWNRKKRSRQKTAIRLPTRAGNGSMGHGSVHVDPWPTII